MLAWVEQEVEEHPIQHDVQQLASDEALDLLGLEAAADTGRGRIDFYWYCNCT